MQEHPELSALGICSNCNLVWYFIQRIQLPAAFSEWL